MRDVLDSANGVGAVLFDVDGTLYHQSPVRRAMIRRILRDNLTNPAACARLVSIISAYRKAQEELRASSFVGDVAAAQIDMAAAAAGVGRSDVQAVVDRWIEVAPLDVVGSSRRDGLVDVLDVLAARGTKLGVVSDYPATRKLEVLGILGRFDVVVAAQDPGVGAFKPNPRALLAALEVLGIPPGDALYVGDRTDVDGGAARAAGMRFHLVGGRRRRGNRSRAMLGVHNPEPHEIGDML